MSRTANAQLQGALRLRPPPATFVRMAPEADRDPLGTYRLRRDRHADVVRRRMAADARIANLRLVAGLAVLPVAWAIWVTRAIPPAWVAVPVAAYVVLAIAHDRVLQVRKRAERLVRHYDFCIARLTDAWVGKGDPGTDFLDTRHPYAEDLDIFGAGSIFELLCTCQTPYGRDLLAEWLKSPAEPAEVRRRQEAVAELRDRLDLREAVVVIAGSPRAAAARADLRAWAKQPSTLAPALTVAVSGMLALAAVAAFVGWLSFGTGLSPLLLVGAVQILWASFLRPRVRPVVRGIEGAEDGVAQIEGVIRLIENREYRAALLRATQDGVRSEGAAASRRIRELERLADRLEWRKNAMFAIPAFLLQWEPFHAVLVDRWRIRHGAVVGEWLDAVATFDALVALASHAFEHPGDAFPAIAGSESGTIFVAESLGHPLIAEARCVRNDVRIDGAQRLLVVSGSNMSGKSTLLRSVGVAAVLAFAGAPVRARACTIAGVHVGASIRRNDSLLEGVSRFYAEIQRLRQLADIATGGRTLLFLIDEILSGTNSHDRRIGAQGILRALLDRGAAGLVTTHDLALTRIAEGFGDDAANVHFEDQIEDGRIAFDYRLRPGVVTRSNALALMRAVGLPIAADGES